jgi:ATP-dependent DNA helicase RecG
MRDWFAQPVAGLVGGPKAKLLAGLGIASLADLLWHLPTAVQDFGAPTTIAAASKDQPVSLTVEIVAHQPPGAASRGHNWSGAYGNGGRRGAYSSFASARAAGHPYRITVRDSSGSAELVFFNYRSVAYLEKLYPIGERRVVSGELTAGMFDLPQITHPSRLLLPDSALHAPRWQPIYPSTAGLAQWWWGKLMRGLLRDLPAMDDWLPPSLRQRHQWPDWQSALRQLHFPHNGVLAAGDHPARQRLVFDELLAQQLYATAARAAQPARHTRFPLMEQDLAAALDLLPFALTDGQHRVLAEIHGDLTSPHLMNRLLQGDVGSGKTVVAFLGGLPILKAGGQVAILAPTTVLAEQHAATLGPLAAALGYRFGLFRGGRILGKGGDAAQLAALASGDIQLAVGTHALLEEAVQFAKLRLVVVDEQHRFGVKQRLNLLEKGGGHGIDLLAMSATPIPRSLAMAFYGDMTSSRLTDKPPGRQPIETRLVSAAKLAEVLGGLKRALESGQQIYWVCPLVAESEKLDLAAAEQRFAELSEQLGSSVGLIHGRQKPAEKQAALDQFRRGQTRLLVATTVIEVGVDVPGANIMVIEGAERFGLSQLHQLRGRVGRGAAAGHCILLYGVRLSAVAKQRLQLMRSCQDGFALAEADLKLRGAGDMLGLRQSGQPLYKLADLTLHSDLVELALDAANHLPPDQRATLTTTYAQLFPQLQSDWKRSG